jgi:hypothetical protein
LAIASVLSFAPCSLANKWKLFGYLSQCPHCFEFIILQPMNSIFTSLQPLDANSPSVKYAQIPTKDSRFLNLQPIAKP